MQTWLSPGTWVASHVRVLEDDAEEASPDQGLALPPAHSSCDGTELQGRCVHPAERVISVCPHEALGPTQLPRASLSTSPLPPPPLPFQEGCSVRRTGPVP